ncbi:hypothetical protein I3843_01G086900 [Carya illinoinensis]|uniref:Myb-like domain-containing protein n=1 Tax=Carya illinoinensis TaxID=32201 RepID=A0A8T1RNE7_CARIL|nr:uncharacterized protein LOC122313610 [Carya illinoinensis]KAG2725930.1 hypothetical protein I3760_01G089100 [Carya illinoinensis]KAG6667351.1 hypothetical protein CIPAW_01G095200 [Carya illinoinensis]KAG6730663.1 hypothetical protein I3842_01G091900 [Carya illinoinensis]KAG7995007.1 hypothetical protein I3843_01G086900 [Carya illinoinensis]
MANPSGNHQEASSSSFNGHVAAGGNMSNGNSGAPPDNQSMKHNPGISLDWTADEQATLEEGLANFCSESNIIRYAKIAMKLPNKSVRDVALRCRWMTKKENSKRRKDEHNLTRKNKEKKERVNDSSAKSSSFVARPIVPPYTPPTMDNDDGISFKAIGGVTGDLLEQNAQALHQISLNLTAMQLRENTSLFCQTRDNIHKIMNDLSLNDTPEVMKQMPPLPVKLNEELANSILPLTNLPMQQ